MSTSQSSSPKTNGDLKSLAGPIGRGEIMAIGGAEDKVKNMTILSQFVEFAGGKSATIAIVPTASSIESAGSRYKAIFLEAGVRSANIAVISDRQDANSDEVISILEGASGIFMTGGNQLRLSSIVGGTRSMESVQRRNQEGAVVAGTSAGASILSSHMVAFGKSGGAPKQRMAQMVAGFGLVTEAIIDQHFRQRNRIGRLLMMVAANPALLGIGVDEDTAAVFNSDSTVDILGRHSVTIVDGSHAYSDIHEIEGSSGITISGTILHSLTEGDRFDLADRVLIR